MTADDAIRQFNTWRQDRSQLRLILSVSSVSLALLGSGEVLEASVADGRLAVKIGDFEFNFLTLDAVFEYAEPREAQLSSIGISQANSYGQEIRTGWKGEACSLSPSENLLA